MSLLERYTPEICRQIRQLAENRHWHSWKSNHPQSAGPEKDRFRQDILEEVELTYHLAAEANGIHAGMPRMDPFPLKLKALKFPGSRAVHCVLFASSPARSMEPIR